MATGGVSADSLPAFAGCILIQQVLPAIRQARAVRCSLYVTPHSTHGQPRQLSGAAGGVNGGGPTAACGWCGEMGLAVTMQATFARNENKGHCGPNTWWAVTPARWAVFVALQQSGVKGMAGGDASDLCDSARACSAIGQVKEEGSRDINRKWFGLASAPHGAPQEAANTACTRCCSEACCEKPHVQDCCPALPRLRLPLLRQGRDVDHQWGCR